MTEIITGIVTAVAVLVAAYLGYLGVRHTTKAAREANRDTVTAGQQDTAVKALESMTLNLLEPYRQEVTNLRGELARERNDRQEKERLDRQDRERKAREIQDQLTAQSERIDVLTIQLRHWKSMARVIARWATTMRDEILRLNGTVPATPEELLTLQAVEDAEGEPPLRPPTTEG